MFVCGNLWFYRVKKGCFLKKMFLSKSGLFWYKRGFCGSKGVIRVQLGLIGFVLVHCGLFGYIWFKTGQNRQTRFLRAARARLDVSTALRSAQHDDITKRNTVIEHSVILR